MRQHLGLKQIDACIISHMHGDHMLEAEHLRKRWGAQVWVLDNMVEKCEHPERFDYVAPVQSYPTGVSSLLNRSGFSPWGSTDWHKAIGLPSTGCRGKSSSRSLFEV